MNYFDDEMNILEHFRLPFGHRIYIPQECQKCDELYSSLIDEDKFCTWINSSGKADPPPDFYNQKTFMMMDIMRIDDHGYVNERGRYINPVNQRESKLQKEIRESELFSLFPNIQSVFVNAVTDLPTDEDHNFKFYFDNFKRTVEKHIESIPLYKKNHPGYNTVFFVFDESSGYVLAENEKQAKKGVKRGEMFYCQPYLHFLDKRFVEIFIDSEIDYLIWYSPYKHFESDMPEIPTICIYDVKKLALSDFKDYPLSLIMSIEE